MPELPEVETVKHQLQNASLINQRIVSVSNYWPNLFKNISPSAFSNRLVGQKLQAIDRRGKFLIFSFDKDKLIIHLRMTGQFLINKSLPKEMKYINACLHFENQVLLFHDTRKFGG